MSGSGLDRSNATCVPAGVVVPEGRCVEDDEDDDEGRWTSISEAAAEVGGGGTDTGEREASFVPVSLGEASFSFDASAVELFRLRCVGCGSSLVGESCRTLDGSKNRT